MDWQFWPLEVRQVNGVEFQVFSTSQNFLFKCDNVMNYCRLITLTSMASTLHVLKKDFFSKSESVTQDVYTHTGIYDRISKSYCDEEHPLSLHLPHGAFLLILPYTSRIVHRMNQVVIHLFPTLCTTARRLSK